MLRIWRRCATSYETVAAEAFAVADDVVWIELNNPTREEEQAVEAALGVEVPTREDMAEIELSSRLYKAKGATYMTALVLSRHDQGPEDARDEPVTFVLVGNRLITVRYAEPKSFALFEAQIARDPRDLRGRRPRLPRPDRGHRRPARGYPRGARRGGEDHRRPHLPPHRATAASRRS